MSRITTELSVVKEIIEFVTTSCHMILDSADSIAQRIDEIIEKTVTIKRIEGEAAAQNRTTCNDLQFAIQKSRNYTATVTDLKAFAINERRLERIYEQIRKDPPNYQPLNDYISDIQRCLGEVTQLHREFSEACNAALSTAERGEIHCGVQQKKQATKKKATQVVGGTATAATFAAGIGTGVALSVVAGVFTFGVGTVVGLGLTAAGATAGGVLVGTAGATATALIADDFKESEKAFRVLKESYNTLLTTGSDMKLKADCLQENLQLIEQKVNAVIHSKDNHETPEYALDILQATLKRLNPNNPLAEQ